MSKFTADIAGSVREELLQDVIKTTKQSLGEVFVVVNTSDTQYNELVRKYPGRVYSTLALAYEAAVSNRNDVILLNGHGTHAVATGIAWSKNRINVIGMDGGDRLVQQGAKVELSGAVDSAYVIKVTGVRNSFRNVKFIQSSTHANALHVMEEGGEGNLYKNCTFTFGNVSNLDLTTATEVLAGSDSATYDRCLFGTETLLTSASGGRTVFTIDQVTTNQEFKSNILKDCIFMISSSDASSLLLKVAATSDVLFTNLFIRPIFMASIDSAGGIALTNAMASVSGLVKGTLNLYLPGTFNCTNTCTTSDGVEVYAPATSGNAHEAVIPA